MKISVELTLTPLADAYAPAIKDFIMRLRSSSFDLRETPLSTQIYGEYDALMPFLTQEIKTTFESDTGVLLHIKMFNTDRNQYVPNF